MKKSILLAVVGLWAYFRTATTYAEMVWLKDVTTRFQTDTRTLSDLDLPDQLFFHLKGKTDDLTLKLKRNQQIDPNADIYIVRKLKDGRSHLTKTLNLEKEDVAYYQDRENGAFMTARCVKRLSGGCDMLINGNIQIRDRSYDLRPSEADIASRNFLEITGLLGRRYVLQDQGNIQRAMSANNKAKTNVNTKNIEKKLTDLLRRIPHGQDKQRQFLRPAFMLSTRNVTYLHNNGTTGENSYSGRNDKDDTIRNLKKEYYVEVAVVLDSGVWDLFLTMVKSKHLVKIPIKAERKIREYYSHIMNGVDLLYKGIEDTDIAISVIIRSFFIFQWEAHFPHVESKVEIVNGKKSISIANYIYDLTDWDNATGSKSSPEYDHAILFTTHRLYQNRHDTFSVAGVSYRGHICDIGLRVQVIHTDDYFKTVYTTAHELGHSLGSPHDGDPGSEDCKADDSFIMSSNPIDFNLDKEYSPNHWIFSKCSVESFKKTLKDKECVHNKGVYTEKELNDWRKLMTKLPGELYTPNQQCHIINGRKSNYCGKIPWMICRFMYCTDPETGKCVYKSLSAATGTTCGEEMWCKQGLCVCKGPNMSKPLYATLSQV